MKSKVHPTYKTKYRVANWPAYNQALVRRGDVTVWLTSEAIAAWTPLSGRALAILHDVQRLSDGTGLVFRSLRGKPLSNTMLSKSIKELGIAAVPHGFRSSFRDWAAERTNTPREVVEAALAHTVQNPTEAAYARSDLFERRRRLMDDWASAIEAT